jgi:SAM-dependent methyltransferase
VSVAYDREFFCTEMEGSRRSAGLIAPVCVELLEPRSVVDVGCGVGTWLAAFRDAGVETITGFDGNYVDRDLLQIPPDSFIPIDLEKPLSHGRRYDLAMCLEVAEHLSPERGPSLVDDLTRLAPAVLFSAAVPFQGGTDHRNEQWQDYWAGLFADRGFQACDCIRPRVWDDPRVDPWYAQNALVYHDSSVQIARTNGMPLRVVHPNMWVRHATRTIPLAALARAAYPSASEAALGQLRKMKRRFVS